MDSQTLKDYARAIQIFVQRNSRWPSELVDDADEVQLAQWLESRRQEYLVDSLNFRDQAFLSWIIPGWRVSNEHRWLRHARELSNLVLCGGMDAVASDAFLNGWLHGQVELLGLGSLDERRAQWFNNYVPGWQSVPRGSVAQTPNP